MPRSFKKNATANYFFTAMKQIALKKPCWLAFFIILASVDVYALYIDEGATGYASPVFPGRCVWKDGKAANCDMHDCNDPDLNHDSSIYQTLCVPERYYISVPPCAGIHAICGPYNRYNSQCKFRGCQETPKCAQYFGCQTEAACVDVLPTGTDCSGGKCYGGNCDTSPPYCSVLGVPSGWQNVPASIELNCTDAQNNCDPNTFFYCKDSATCSPSTNYTGPVAFSSAGYLRGKVKDYSTQESGICTSDYVRVDMVSPVTSDNSGGAWRNSDQTVTLTCSDSGGSGCAQTSFCVYREGDSPCSPYVAGAYAQVTCPQDSACRKIVRYNSSDAAGNSETPRDSNVVKIDKTIPRLFSVSAAPDPFSPNGDGVKDSTVLSFSTDEEPDGTGYTATIKVYGPSGLVRTLFENKPVNAGAHPEVWDGRNDAGAVVPDGLYSYKITVVDRVGNVNSTLGYVHVDLSGPQFLDYSPLDSVVELGDPVNFSATLSDVSGVDSVVACKASANCHNTPAQQFCRLDNTSQYRDKFSCAFTPSEVKTYSYYIFANDSQNLFSSAGGSFRVRNVSVSVDAGPRIVDRQGSVRIAANYTENSSYPIGGAACSISGDVSGSMVFDGVQYYANNVRPSGLEANSFTVTCSKPGFPARSSSGSFVARDLSIGLDYEYEPLAAGKPNFLYARVNTVSKYARVESANRVVFNVTRDTDGFLVPSGNLAWNPATGRWEANFTPPDEGNYTVRAYFNATVEGGVLDGFSSIRMAGGKGFRLSSDSSGPLSVDMGSSGRGNILVENRRRKDVLYNITLTGDLYPVSFDGQALSSRRYKTFALVPANSMQSHPLLIKGLEVSPFAKEVRIQFREAQPPYDSGNITVTYAVVSSRDNRKFAPDLDFAAIVLLALASVLFIPKRKGPVFP